MVKCCYKIELVDKGIVFYGFDKGKEIKKTLPNTLIKMLFKTAKKEYIKKYGSEYNGSFDDFKNELVVGFKKQYSIDNN